MKDIGKKTNNMAMGSSHGQMVLDTKETMLRGKSTERECSPGPMRVLMKGNSLKITSKGKEYISGLMAEPMKAIGKTIRWMVMECLLGPMGECMKESTLMIRKMEEVPSLGQMEENI